MNSVLQRIASVFAWFHKKLFFWNYEKRYYLLQISNNFDWNGMLKTLMLEDACSFVGKVRSTNVVEVLCDVYEKEQISKQFGENLLEITPCVRLKLVTSVPIKDRRE